MYMHICKDMGFSSGVESKLKVGGGARVIRNGFVSL